MQGLCWKPRGRRAPGGRCTFLIFLFHSSFATRTLAVFCARPAETTMPFVSFTNRPAALAAVAAVVATAVLLDIAPVSLPPRTAQVMLPAVWTGVISGEGYGSFVKWPGGSRCARLVFPPVGSQVVDCSRVEWLEPFDLKFNGNVPARHRYGP